MARLRSAALASTLLLALLTLTSCLRLIGGSELHDQEGGPPNADVPDAEVECATALSCDDGDGCTVDRCDEATGACVHSGLDADGDGHAPASCGGGDCDDGDRARSPDAPEACNGVDDDCDGEIDESCCTVEPCTTACGSRGERECTAEGLPGDCIPPAEACDGVDDDCDDAVDEGCCTPGPCRTSCDTTGDQRCNPDGTYGACEAPGEICNERDDDCDGEVDEGCCAPGPCTTVCGTEGTILCNPDGSTGGCTPPDEACGDGRDDDCDGGIDEGCCTVEPCTTACGSEGERACIGGVPGDCIPPAESCDGVDDDCDGEIDEGCCAPGPCTTSCGTTGDQRCNPDGSYGVCAPPAESCNGRDDDCDSVCENGFACCSGATMSCVEIGYDSGIATCAPGCGSWDVGGCAFCGNGSVDPGEDCDGADLGGADCTTVPGGFDGGSLGCLGTCAFDTSGCTGSWDPSGTYSLAPAIDFTCAYGIVSINLPTLALIDTGATLSADMGRCTMTGPSAADSRAIDISCTIPGGGGGCTETYALTGSFADDDHWTGTLAATFVGTCLGCTNQSWPVSGARM